MKKELEKLNKLIAENPDMKVVFLIDLEYVEEPDMHIEMVICDVRIIDRAEYSPDIYDDRYYYGIDNLIDDIIEVEGIDEVAAKKEAISLMKKTIVVRLAT